MAGKRFLIKDRERAGKELIYNLEKKHTWSCPVNRSTDNQLHIIMSLGSKCIFSIFLYIQLEFAEWPEYWIQVLLSTAWYITLPDPSASQTGLCGSLTKLLQMWTFSKDSASKRWALGVKRTQSHTLTTRSMRFRCHSVQKEHSHF